MEMTSLPCADISNYSREDKDMLRGAGLMSQASGLGPASARTTTAAPAKVRLYSRCNCSCPLRNLFHCSASACSLSLLLHSGRQAPGLFSATRTTWHVLSGDNVVGIHEMLVYT